jgi:hypothetical protein
MVNVERVVDEVWLELEKFMSVQPYGSFVNLTVSKHIPGWSDYEFRDKVLLILELKKRFGQLGYEVEIDLNSTKLEVANTAAVASGKNGAFDLWQKMVADLFQYVFDQANLAQNVSKQRFTVDVYEIIKGYKYPTGFSEEKLLSEVEAFLLAMKQWRRVSTDVDSRHDMIRSFVFER